MYKQATMILNFSNPSIFTIERAYIKLSSLLSVSCFIGKCWPIWKIQNHGGAFIPNDGKGSFFDAFYNFEKITKYVLFLGGTVCN